MLKSNGVTDFGLKHEDQTDFMDMHAHEDMGIIERNKCGPFSVSTSICDTVLAKWAYRN